MLKKKTCIILLLLLFTIVPLFAVFVLESILPPDEEDIECRTEKNEQ